MARTTWRLDEWNKFYGKLVLPNDQATMNENEIKEEIEFLKEHHYPKPEDCHGKNCPSYRSTCSFGVGICEIAYKMVEDFYDNLRMNENKKYGIIKEFQGKYRFLSNFWRCRIVYYEEKYNSVEHAYQAAKFTDKDIREKIKNAKTLGEAKRIARRNRDKIRKDWNEVNLKIMEQLVIFKFLEPDLYDKLIETGQKYLQEGNYWGDTFWGVDLKTGKGKNNLGKILMKVRDGLRDG